MRGVFYIPQNGYVFFPWITFINSARRTTFIKTFLWRTSSRFFYKECFDLLTCLMYSRFHLIIDDIAFKWDFKNPLPQYHDALLKTQMRYRVLADCYFKWYFINFPPLPPFFPKMLFAFRNHGMEWCTSIWYHFANG